MKEKRIFSSPKEMRTELDETLGQPKKQPEPPHVTEHPNCAPLVSDCSVPIRPSFSDWLTQERQRKIWEALTGDEVPPHE